MTEVVALWLTRQYSVTTELRGGIKNKKYLLVENFY